jgi:uncharacterized protein YihD (DUF1040 family)
MRDSKRMDIVLNLLKEYWILNPDLRFGQIVGLLQNDTIDDDLFNVEDEDLMKHIQKHINNC